MTAPVAPPALAYRLMEAHDFATGPHHARLIGSQVSGFMAFSDSDDAEERNAIAARLVACWNACAGIADPEAELDRLRAMESAVGHVQKLGEGVRALLPDMELGIEEALANSKWCVVDRFPEPRLVMTGSGTWAPYPSSEAHEYACADDALDCATRNQGDVVRSVRVG